MAIVLGIGPPAGHNSAAALLVDGKLVAAAEEERFSRLKNASEELPLQSVQYCLNQAGLKAGDVDHVTFGWSPEAFHRAKWFYAAEMLATSFYDARKIISKAGKINRTKQRLVEQTLLRSGFDQKRTKVSYVEHQIAHAASAYLFSGFQDAAFLSMDGSGEFITMLLGEIRNGQLFKIKEIYNPHSLGLFYSTVTEYLGFESNEGEYKVMGMAPYGDPDKIDLSCMVRKTSSGFKMNMDYVWVIEKKRYQKEKMYSRKMVETFGPPRRGDGLSEPYIHIAAAAQRTFEDLAIFMLEKYLTPVLKKHKTLCLAGGCALNVVLNKKFLEHPLVEKIFVPPAANDAGTASGSAAYVASMLGDSVEPIISAYLGPSFSDRQIKEAMDRLSLSYKVCDDPIEEAAGLLAQGEIVGWFQGRMEFGPRALGNRSILANPTVAGSRDKINAIVKFREGWRPFCPSVLEEYAAEILGTNHEAPFMTTAFQVQEKWRDKIPEVVHVDGTARPQTVNKMVNPLYYELIRRFHEKTGIPLVLNTSLNRRGEPIVCTPEDAAVMFLNSGLPHLFLGNIRLSKF